METNNKLYKSILFALITAVISGVSIFYAKFAATKIDPLVLTTSRNMFVGLLFLLYIVKRNSFKHLMRITRKQLIQLIIVGFIGGAIPFYLFFFGLQYTTAFSANFIHKTLFFWAGILAIVLLKEKQQPIYFFTACLILASQLLFSGTVFSFGKGELMIIFATILWSVEQIISKKALKNITPEILGLFRMGTGGLILFFISLVAGKGSSFFQLSAVQLTYIVVGGSLLFGYVFFWYKALRYGSVSLVTLILTLSTVIGAYLNGTVARLNILPNETYLSLVISASVFFLLIRTISHSRSFTPENNK